jgi:UPF0755 protein
VSKRIARAFVIVFALMIIIAPLAGIVVILRSRTPSPEPGTAGAVTVGKPSSGGLERSLIGMYLNLHDADLHRPAGNDATPVKFVVNAGDSADIIGRNLQTAGLITDAELFRQYVKYQGVGENLQAGEYELEATMTMEQVVVALQKSRRQEVRVTVREGWRLEQIADMLSQNGLSTSDDLLKVMRSGKFDETILSARPAGVSLEGYLYPDTYQMDPRWTPEQIVDLLLNTMDKRFTPAMRQQATAQKLTVHQVLIIASIIERETAVASERPLIASVYLNRIAKNMPLEADPTVQYALGFDKAQQRWWPQITADQYRSTASPYNTYLSRDLPPGPICSPAQSAIDAVLQPAKSDYLYYLAKGDGTHVFARTFDEHLDNQKKYQK